MLERNKLQKHKLIFAILLPIVSLLLWFYTDIGKLMYSADVLAARAANDSLHLSKNWSWFWALMNSREEKYLNVVSILGLNLWYIFSTNKEKRIISLSQVILMWAYIQGGVLLINFVFHDLTNTERFSPSLVLKPFLRLSEYFNDSDIKDLSKRSFPGGHGFAMFYWIFFSSKFVPKKIFIPTVFVGIFLCVPRFMSGAHWISDIAFAGMLAYAYVGTMIWTPLYSTSVNYIIKTLQLLKKLVRNIAAVAQQDRAQDS